MGETSLETNEPRSETYRAGELINQAEHRIDELVAHVHLIANAIQEIAETKHAYLLGGRKAPDLENVIRESYKLTFSRPVKDERS